MIDSLVHKLWMSTGYNPFYSTDGTLNSLLNSNRIDLISDNSLKEKLTSYHSDYSTYKEHEEEYEHYVKVLRKFAGKHFSFSPYVKELEDIEILIPINETDWLSNLSHQNEVAGMAIMFQWYVTPSLENLSVKTTEILNLLNESITQ